MTETSDKARQARADAIEGLRHLADVFEANPHLPVPHFLAWSNGFRWERTESERFSELHDLADALGGVPVMEEPKSGERSLRVEFGALKLHATAAADKREAQPAPVPRPVQRPVHAGGE